MGLLAQVGPFDRTIKRGYNYALVLEGLFPRGGAPPPGKYPFMAQVAGRRQVAGLPQSA